MAGRGGVSLKKRLLQFSWGKVVILLVLLLASQQVLHMMLLSRLEEKNAHLQKERTLRSLQKETQALYASMKELLENTHIVDASGLYKVIKSFFNTAKGSSNGANTHQHRTKVHSTPDSQVRTGVTLVSQCSVNHLVHLAALSERWKGPISVAVFAVDSQSVGAAIDYLLHLYHCVPSVRQNVSVHLVYPLVQIIKSLPEFRPVDHSVQCSDLAIPPSQKLVQSRNYAFTSNTKYPNNLLRNVAISNAETEYIFVIDIDMLPNSKLNRDFIDFTERHSLAKQNKVLDEQTIFVVPAFELQNGLPVPENKNSLLQLWKRREVRPFYYEMCWRCQKPTDYDAWRNLSHSASLSVGYEVEWKDPWEPFYIGPKSIPLYDERFKQYGFNRISQVCELHVAGFKFAVLDNSFLVHQGFKTPDTFHLTKDMEQEKNRLLFRQFKEELKNKYPETQRRCY